MSSQNKVIPEYAKDYKREWQCITGINKICGELIRKLDFGGKIFNYHIANRIKYLIKNFLKGQERGKLKDISNFCFNYYDTNFIDCLEEQMIFYYDFYIDPDSYEFDKKYYELNIDNDFPGFRELIGLVVLFNNKIKKD